MHILNEASNPSDKPWGRFNPNPNELGPCNFGASATGGILIVDTTDHVTVQGNSTPVMADIQTDYGKGSRNRTFQ